MNEAIGAFNRLAVAWMEVAWTVSWQAVLVLGGFATVAWVRRGSSPALRCWLWQIAAIKLMVMPLWGASMALPEWQVRYSNQPEPEPSAARTGLDPNDRRGDRRLTFDREGRGNGTLNSSPERRFEPLAWQAWFMLGWTSLVVGQVVAISLQRHRLIRLLGRATPLEDPALLALIGELSGRVGLSKAPQTLLIAGQCSPFVCRPLWPTLVLPEGLVGSLPLDSLRPVLLHELSHIRRRDLIWGWLPTVARLLYVLHPAAHYIAFRARLERELACDQAAMVLAGQGAAGYASTLVEVVGRSFLVTGTSAKSASSRLDGPQPCLSTHSA